MMIKPSIEELTKGKYNRYTLCMACAKCARMVTDEYVEQRREAEELIAKKETCKSLASMINRDIRDEKAVKNAIRHLYEGDVRIILPKGNPALIEQQREEEQAARAEAEKAAEAAARQADAE